MKEKVKIIPSDFRIDVSTMTYPELRAKYGLSTAMIKRAMNKLGIEKTRVQSAPFEIVEELRDLKDIRSDVSTYRETDSVDERIEELPIYDGTILEPGLVGGDIAETPARENLFGISSNS